MKVLARNKKAYFDYEILSEVTAGLRLKGWQVKSIKSRQVNLKNSYCYIQHGECFLRDVHISEWPGMGEFEKKNKDQDIKLLLHKSEIEKLAGKSVVAGVTLVPLKLLEHKGLIKVAVGLVRGKKKYDKRAKIKEREAKRDIARQLKSDKYF